MNRVFTSLAAIALVAGGASAAVAKNPMVGGAAMYPTKNIVQNAVNSKDHTTLVAGGKAAGVGATQSGAGPVTGVAPPPASAMPSARSAPTSAEARTNSPSGSIAATTARASSLSRRTASMRSRAREIG